MLRSIVLLCPPGDRFYLSGILTLHNPALTVVHVATADALEAAAERAGPDTRLIAFLTGVIVPAALLVRFTGPSYNFHPGPPAYPGKHPVAFALYDGAPRYGATAHEMTAVVDAGPIIGAVEFDVPPGARHTWIKERAYDAMIRLFLLLAPRLATSPEPLPRVSAAWGPRRCTQKAAEALCTLPHDIDAAELQRRLHAFGEADGLQLRMSLHGRRFVLIPD